MNKVFIYATLKAYGVQREALGEKHGHKETPALLLRFQEKAVPFGTQHYPTLVYTGGDYALKGDIIEVNDDELAKLDAWESHYRRIEVNTNKGPAWAYVFKEPKGK